MVKSIPPRHTFSFGGTTHNIYHGTIGDGLPRHDHEYNHATVCHSGSVLIRKENKEVMITKESTPVVLIGKEWHELEIMEPNTVFENVFIQGAR